MKKPTRERIVPAVCVVVTVLILVAVVKVCYVPSAEVAISFIGYTNSSTRGSAALVLLRNTGEVPLRRHEFGTLDWSDGSGNSTQYSALFSPSNRVILPQEAETLILDLHGTPAEWQMAFAFTIEPNSIQKRLGSFIGSGPLWMPPERGRTMLFFLSPKLTNGILSAP